MKEKFEIYEAFSQPDWDKSKNWNTIHSQLEKQKINYRFGWLVKYTLISILLLSGWAYGWYQSCKISSGNNKSLVEKKFYPDTVFAFKTIYDTIILVKTVKNDETNELQKPKLYTATANKSDQSHYSDDITQVPNLDEKTEEIVNILFSHRKQHLPETRLTPLKTQSFADIEIHQDTISSKPLARTKKEYGKAIFIGTSVVSAPIFTVPKYRYQPQEVGLITKVIDKK